jgi:hypothetical protein
VIPWGVRTVRLGVMVVALVGACGRINYDPLGSDDDVDAEVDGAPGIDVPDGGACPASYTPMNGTCYRPVATARDWLAAEMDCEADGDGSHLAIIVDVAEHFDLHALAESSGIGAESWIGYTDRITEGTFMWIGNGGLDPSLDECFFGPSGPTNNPTIDCVVQQSATMCGDWFVRDCAATRGYICEHDGQTPVDGTF